VGPVVGTDVALDTLKDERRDRIAATMFKSVRGFAVIVATVAVGACIMH
jgi:hypothetical protein